MSKELMGYNQRIYEKTDKKKFEEAKNYLDDKNKQYSNQNTGLFLIRLGFAKLQQLKQKQKDINQHLP